MNIPPTDDNAREREWQAQERALRAERLRTDAASDDARVLRYRVLAHALRQPSVEALPADFARDVARQIDATVADASQMPDDGTAVYPFDAPFERNLLRALVAAFGLSIGIVIALYAGSWMAPTRDAVLIIAGVLKNPWLLTLAGCIVLSAALQGLRRDTR
jgi:hypothetical protein